MVSVKSLRKVLVLQTSEEYFNCLIWISNFQMAQADPPQVHPTTWCFVLRLQMLDSEEVCYVFHNVFTFSRTHFKHPLDWKTSVVLMMCWKVFSHIFADICTPPAKLLKPQTQCTRWEMEFDALQHMCRHGVEIHSCPLLVCIPNNELCSESTQFIASVWFFVSVQSARRARAIFATSTQVAKGCSQAGTHAIREQSEAQLALTSSIVPAVLVQCPAH